MKNKEEVLQYFAPLYLLKKLYGQDGLDNPEKYEKDQTFLNEVEKLSTDKNLINEISIASEDNSGKHSDIWDKINQLTAVSAKKGAKLDYLISLSKYKKGKKINTKKCKCGCDMINVKEDGGKIVSKCSCNCGGGKVKKKERGGILDEYDLDDLLGSGVLNSSIANKFERQIHSNKLGKFKK